MNRNYIFKKMKYRYYKIIRVIYLAPRGLDNGCMNAVVVIPIFIYSSIQIQIISIIFFPISSVGGQGCLGRIHSVWGERYFRPPHPSTPLIRRILQYFLIAAICPLLWLQYGVRGAKYVGRGGPRCQYLLCWILWRPLSYHNNNR